MAILGGAYDIQECPRIIRNECVIKTNALRRDTGPGGRLGKQEASRVVEVDWDRRNVVKDARHVAYRPYMVRERCRTMKHKDGGAGVNRGRARALGQCDHH